MQRESQQATVGGSRMSACSSLGPSPYRTHGLLGIAVSPPPRSMTGVAYPEESHLSHLIPLDPGESRKRISETRIPPESAARDIAPAGEAH